MRRTLPLQLGHTQGQLSNLIQIRNGTFYREHPSRVAQSSASDNPPLFPGLNFELPATSQRDAGRPLRKSQHWAVIGATANTTFLEILRGLHLCFPPNARTFPYLASEEIEKKDHRLRTPSRAIQYAGFTSGKGQSLSGGIRGAYLSARYESRREETDWSVIQYLKGQTELNPSQKEGHTQDGNLLDRVMRDLRLHKLADMPVSNLSNGQTRRARIAKALLGKPELLLLDEPFMGLDPPTLVSLSPILRELAYRSSPLLILGLRPQDPVPDWITHLVLLGDKHNVIFMGEKAQVLFHLHCWTYHYATIKDLSIPRPNPRTDNDFMLVRALHESYGPPPLEVGHTLTASGIERYNQYEAAKNDEDIKYFTHIERARHGNMINPSFLDAENKKLWQEAKAIDPSRRTLDQMLVLASALPATLRGGAGVQLEQKERREKQSAIAVQQHDAPSATSQGEPLIELSSVVVKYGDKVVLGHSPPQPRYKQPGLNLSISQGTRLALLGPNGSGKTTLLSLLTSDHPQSYSLPIKFFGRTRLPSRGKPGLSLWDIQSRIGHSSPEIHQFFPKHFSVRQVLESAWAETYTARPKLTYNEDILIDAYLRWWEPELRQDTPPLHHSHDEPIQIRRRKSAIHTMCEQSEPRFVTAFTPRPGPTESSEPAPPASDHSDIDWADSKVHSFSTLPFSAQRLLLFLRAIIKSPDIIILDEAFSGLSAEVREKAMCWLQYGETKVLRKAKTSNDLVPVKNCRLDVETICERFGHDPKLYASLQAGSNGALELYNLKMEELEKVVKEEEEEGGKKDWLYTGLSSKQALVVVSHVKEEIPPIVDEWLRLPGEEEVIESGKGVERGRCANGELRTLEGWNKVWNM